MAIIIIMAIVIVIIVVVISSISSTMDISYHICCESTNIGAFMEISIFVDLFNNFVSMANRILMDVAQSDRWIDATHWHCINTVGFIMVGD